MPGLAPGESVAPEPTARLPATVPEPPIVWVEGTVYPPARAVVSKVAPAVVVTDVAEAIDPAAPSARVPCSTETAPEYELPAVSVTRPAPDFARTPAVPETAPVMVMSPVPPMADVPLRLTVPLHDTGVTALEFTRLTRSPVPTIVSVSSAIE